ncbi:phospholipase D-like domain-containing protein [Natrarchaeobius chitinivorans]|uniref:Phospholipase n=1 Tax=Natrarchaeobius chitinivorans TaxID=1679083 RepID=A0A3N6MI82_NATCH|nr:phospholipase D-like domain-containing protein [Natrarchaeobius chitinivorans]RQG96660.1 phospholipase [Natrarchaeobius chitinivorans]
MTARRIALVTTLVSAFLLASAVGSATALGAPATDRDELTTSTDPVTDGLECAPQAGSDSDTTWVPVDGTGAPASEPRIVELYPNPTTYGNVGEYLVLETPTETRPANWTITDGHTTATVPNESVAGRVALSTDPDATAELTEYPVLELEGTVRLAVDGDELELRNGTETVDAVAYDSAPTAERWYRLEADARGDDGSIDPAEGRWHPRDGTCFSVATVAVDEATTFVLPDSPEVPLETIRETDDRLLLGAYTLTSPAVAEALVDAAGRGVDVAVLLESGPVGGTPAETEPILDRLEDGDVGVRAVGGEGARYRFHHAKYAVVDDRVLVTSENWGPSGTGGESSRGWGVRLEDPELADALAKTFRADYEGWDTETGAAFRSNATFVDGDGEDRDVEFATDHGPETVPVDSAELLVTPDNAAGRLEELLGDADDEILVKQASIAPDGSVLEETLAAARRGVDVRILLDATWYHEDENAELVADLERAAADEDLPLEAKLVDDRTDRFEKIHAKGAIVDGEAAVVGSANWNDNAFENNREVLVVLHGESAADYYATVFEADWEGATWRLPIGLSLVTVVALAGAAAVGRRYVRFGDR